MELDDLPGFTVEKTHRPALLRIVNLPLATYEALKKALQTLPATTSRVSLAKHVAKNVRNLSESDADGLLNILFYLRSVLSSSGQSVEQFASDVRQGFVTKRRKLTPIEDSQLATLYDRLVELFQIDRLRSAAKAVDLRFDYPNVFQGVRVLTDLRPVFESGSDPSMAGVIISQTLKINYYSAEGAKELYVLLDNEDIASVRKALDRADEKATILAQVLASARIKNLDE